MCQCGAAYPASTLRIHNVSVWLQFGQVNFLPENFVVTTYFRIPHMSKFCSILFFVLTTCPMGHNYHMYMYLLSPIKKNWSCLWKIVHIYSKGTFIQSFTGRYVHLMSIGYNRPSFNRKDQQRYCRIHYIPILIWITYLTEPIVIKLNVVVFLFWWFAKK